MRGIALKALTIAALLDIINAHGQPSVLEFGTFNDLRNYTGSAAHAIVDGRLSNGDGGGGEFFQNGTEGAGKCNHLTDDDDGVILVGNNTGSGATHPCWYRQFSGPVHLAWYGVPDAAVTIMGVTSCYVDETHFEGCAADAVPRTDTPTVLQNAVQKAFDAVNWALTNRAKLPGADGGVVTDGRSIVIANGNLHIAQNGYFSCSENALLRGSVAKVQGALCASFYRAVPHPKLQNTWPNNDLKLFPPRARTSAGTAL